MKSIHFAKPEAYQHNAIWCTHSSSVLPDYANVLPMQKYGYVLGSLRMRNASMFISFVPPKLLLRSDVDK